MRFPLQSKQPVQWTSSVSDAAEVLDVSRPQPAVHAKYHEAHFANKAAKNTYHPT